MEGWKEGMVYMMQTTGRVDRRTITAEQRAGRAHTGRRSPGHGVPHVHGSIPRYLGTRVAFGKRRSVGR